MVPAYPVSGCETQIINGSMDSDLYPCSVRKLSREDALAVLPPHCAKWTEFPLDTVDLLLNECGSVHAWATLPYWRRKQFSLLIALAARVPDFSMYVCFNCTEDEFAVAAKVGDKMFVAQGSGPSKSRAKEAVAENLFAKADIMGWLSENHSDTNCASHLIIK